MSTVQGPRSESLGSKRRDSPDCGPQSMSILRRKWNHSLAWKTRPPMIERPPDGQKSKKRFRWAHAGQTNYPSWLGQMSIAPYLLEVWDHSERHRVILKSVPVPDSWPLASDQAFTLRMHTTYFPIYVGTDHAVGSDIFECVQCGALVSSPVLGTLSAVLNRLQIKWPDRSELLDWFVAANFIKKLARPFYKMVMVTAYQPPRALWEQVRYHNLPESEDCEQARHLRTNAPKRFKRAWEIPTPVCLPHIEDAVIKGQMDFDIRQDATPSEVRTPYYNAIYNQRLLNLWKNTAGSSKSWRLSPLPSRPFIITAHNQRGQQSAKHRTSHPTMFLPSTFLWSRPPGVHFPSGCKSRCRVRDKRPRPKVDPEITVLHHEVDHVHYSSARGSSVPAHLENIDRDSGQAASSTPGQAFIRLVLKAQELSNGFWHVERFLPSDLTFRNGWCLRNFLRDESHADVYSVSPENPGSSNPEADPDLEAHVFLNECHGNSKYYADRHKKRMRKTGKCLETFWYNDRHVFIMAVPTIMPPFKLRNNDKEFPALVDQKIWAKKVTLREHLSCRTPTYVAVLRHAPADNLKDAITQHERHCSFMSSNEIKQRDHRKASNREKQQRKRQAKRDSRKECAARVI